MREVNGVSAPVAADLAFTTEGVMGLTQAQAQERLRQFGPNALPAQQSRGFVRIGLEVVREPMFLLLLAAGTLYFATGKTGDALMLLGFVFVVMAITIVQERRTERALDALKALSNPRALAIRDGRAKRIAGDEVVPGDVLIVAEGDRVPADALLRRATNLSTDESLLTGESVPVRKTPSREASSLGRPGGDDLPALFSGTLVTAGQGLCEVMHTGMQTQIGHIGTALQQIPAEITPLQLETRRIVRSLAMLGLAACLTVVISYALTRGASVQAWKDGMLAGIAMAMAILPEEFPVILTVFLALGAWRISKSRVLTRRLPAIETLGATTVLCVDKTGTLTENRMALCHVVAGGQSMRLAAAQESWPPACRAVLDTAVLASRADPFDPMERALHEALAQAGRHAAAAPGTMALLREYPLSSRLLAVTQVWRAGPSDVLVLAAKGAPEAIARLCRLTHQDQVAMMAQVASLADDGLRVLAVARAELAAQELPAEHGDLRLQFAGLVAFEDPVRRDVPPAVAECRSAGIRVVMITGDYPATAQSIARQAGLERADAVMTGAQLDRLDDAELAARVGEIHVFARVIPEQKLRVVNALKARGEVVAMTGDGVNDAPALKAAHIGIAMGGRGTDVAREAAALVLLDDSFASIVAAIRLGRRIYSNIRKAIAFTLAVHVPIAGLSMLPVFFADWPLLLLPVHIVFLELIIDPACSLVFEAEAAEPKVMQRPPRAPAARLFSRPLVAIALLQGLSALATCLAIFALARSGHDPAAARVLVYVGLVVAVVVMILVNRSWARTAIGMFREPNAAVWWVVGGASGLLATILSAPAARRLFEFGAPAGSDLALSVLCGAACLAWFELAKLTPFWRRLRLDQA